MISLLVGSQMVRTNPPYPRTKAIGRIFSAFISLMLYKPVVGGGNTILGGLSQFTRFLVLWLALLACGGAYWLLVLEPSAVTSRHLHYCGHPPAWKGIQNATSAHGVLP